MRLVWRARCKVLSHLCEALRQAAARSHLLAERLLGLLGLLRRRLLRLVQLRLQRRHLGLNGRNLALHQRRSSVHTWWRVRAQCTQRGAAAKR